MGRVARSILAVIGGFITAGIVMMIVESIMGHVLYPTLARARLAPATAARA